MYGSCNRIPYVFDVKVFRAKRRHVDAEKKHYVCVLLNAIFVNSFLRGEEVGCFELQMVQVGCRCKLRPCLGDPRAKPSVLELEEPN